jgi:hypothetical protein
VGNNSNGAAIDKDSGVYRTTFWAYSYEAIGGAGDRLEAMQTVLNWCTPAGPNIDFEKTVGTDPGACASNNVLDLPYGGGEVTYCYEVTNTGVVTLTEHDLVDSELGTLLSGFAHDLTPGSSVWITASTMITQTTVNLATWTAGDGVDSISRDSSATVNVAPPEPMIAVNPAAVTSAQAPDNQVGKTLTISNVGTGDLDWSIVELAPVVPPPTGAGPLSGSPERLGVAAPVESAIQPKAAAGGGVVADGSFEAGTPNPSWNEASTNFGTPLCTVAGCTTGTGTGPRTGSWWAWFGGIGAYEEGSVDQDVTIESGTATLSFYLEQIVCDSAADYLEVLIDGNQVFVSDGSSALCGVLGYSLQSVDISAYADGGTHNLEFHSEIFATNGGGSNFFVDDVTIDVIPGVSCSSPSDISWASVSPTSGTTTGGNASDVTVTFDSTGLVTGVYTATLCIESNDMAGNEVVSVPLTMTVETPSYGVGIDPEAALTGLAGATVTYTLYITNTGNTADTFDLAATGNSWTTTLSDSSVSLNVGESTMVWVTVDIPTGVADGDMDVATVTATSAGDSGVSASATLTTTAEVEGYFIYLPFVAKDA